MKKTISISILVILLTFTSTSITFGAVSKLPGDGGGGGGTDYLADIQMLGNYIKGLQYTNPSLPSYGAIKDPNFPH